MLNKYRLSLGLFALWWLYFFSLFLAQWSPVLVFFQEYARILLGDIGVNVFFALCIVAGLLILAKGYLMKVILRWFVSLLVILSAIFNFPLIDGESGKYEMFGGYLSYPVLRILDKMFGGQAIAVKWFVIVLFVSVLIWILYTLNFSLPKLNFNLHIDSKPTPKKEDGNKTKVERYYDESPKHTHSTHEMGAPISASVIKTMLKQKVQEKIAEKEEKIRPVVSFSKDKPTFDIALMETNVGQTATIDEAFLMEKARALQSKLMEFGVAIQIDGFDIGPSIVQLRIKPDAGVKLSSIESLRDDIASSLKTKSLRIIAPIPGTDSVWIQIPNPKPSMVRLGDVLGSGDFATHMKKSFTNLSLGKSVDGSMVIKTLESMPHLLVAWATGSGKSVWVNDFILSLIYQNTPSELKFLMVDPKQVELELYSGLPYLLWPIIHESEKAIKLLKWAVAQMEKRYGLLKEKRVKNIDEYNTKVMADKMFRIVIVIDELAELMLSSKNRKEVEWYITRIAQKARAIGMHLIVATQRPSVDVITGLIKANIPTRIAFWVVSEIDSRTILWRQWAETLLGKWDLLYMDPTTREPIRIQAPFVDTDEIENIVEKLKDKYMKWLSENDIYEPEILDVINGKREGGAVWWSWDDAGADEELVQQAIQVVAQTRKASATLLQRKLNVWFARAARIMDIMEERGVIWPQDWAKPRDIYL